MKFVGIGPSDIVNSAVTLVTTGSVNSVAAGPWTATGSNVALLSFTWGTGGSVQLQGSVDGTTWVKLPLWGEADLGTSDSSVTSVSTSGTFRAVINGYQQFRIIVLTSGTVNGTVSTVFSTAEVGPTIPISVNALPAGANTIGNVNQNTSTTGTIAAAGTANAISLASLSSYGTATITVHGTYVAALTFQLSDDNGATWYAGFGTRIDGTGGESTTLTLTNINQGWQFGLGGVTNIRVYASTYTSGTANIKISVTAGLTDPAVYIGGGTVSLAQGGNTANVDSNNRLYAYQPDRTITGTLIPNSTTNTVSLTGLSGYGQAVISWPATSGTGTVITEVTVDGTNWFGVPMWSVTTTAALAVNQALALSAAVTLRVPIMGYQGIRQRCISTGGNAGTSVTITASSFVSPDPQSSTASIGQVSVSSLPALPTGANTIGKVTSTNDATSTSAYSVAATTVVKASAGRLVSVLVTTQGTADVKIYDNASAASGTIIGYVPATATVGSILPFTAPAANGITVGGVAGNAAFTVLYT